MRNFTPEDLLEFHYGDMLPPRALELEKELENNWALRQKLEVIQEAATRLDKSMVEPPAAVVCRVLEYARAQVGQNAAIY